MRFPLFADLDLARKPKTRCKAGLDRRLSVVRKYVGTVVEENRSLQGSDSKEVVGPCKTSPTEDRHSNTTHLRQTDHFRLTTNLFCRLHAPDTKMHTARALSSRSSIRAAGPRVAPRRQQAQLVSPHVCRGVQFNEQFMGECHPPTLLLPPPPQQLPASQALPSTMKLTATTMACVFPRRDPAEEPGA